MSEQKLKMVLPHSEKSLCVADVPYIETWAIMDSCGQTDGQDKFEVIIERKLDHIKQEFINGAINGVSLDAESKESAYDQMVNSIKPVNEWLEYYSHLGIEIIIAEPSTASGRYTLDDASKYISGETNEPWRDVLNGITRAVLDGSLPVYRLESQLRFYPRKIDRFYDAYWYDLNHWLEIFLPLLDFRFPKPSSSPYKDFKNKSSGEPFSHPPQIKDEWYEVIEAAMCRFNSQHGIFPTCNQLWSELWSNPPEEYGVTTGKDRGRADALLMGGQALCQNSLYKRYRRYSR